MVLPALTLRSQTNVRMAIVVIPHNIQSLYVGLNVRVTSVGVGANIRGLRLSATVRFGFVVGAQS